MDSKIYRICGHIGYMESKSRNIAFTKKDSKHRFEYRIKVNKSQKWSAQVIPVSMPILHNDGQPVDLTQVVAEFLRKVDLVVDTEEALDIAVGVVVSNICCFGEFCLDGVYDS